MTKNWLISNQINDFSLKNLEIVTKFDTKGQKVDTLILNDGRIARIIDNSLIIYNKNNFIIQINIKAKKEIYNIYQLKNNKLIVIFEHFLMIYKLKKDKIFLLQKIFFGFEYDKYYIIKDFSKSHIKASFSPEILEISNKSFIIKFRIKRKTTDKDPYAEYDSPDLYIRVYEYDKNKKGYIFKRSLSKSDGAVSRILDTFIIHTTKYGSLSIYRKDNVFRYDPSFPYTYQYYPLNEFIKGGEDNYYHRWLKPYVWKNKYLLYDNNQKIEIYEFDKDYNEHKIKEIKGRFLPLERCNFYYNSENPVFFYFKNDFGPAAFTEYNDNFEEIKNEDFPITKWSRKIYDIKIINNFVYILELYDIFILKKKS